MTPGAIGELMGKEKTGLPKQPELFECLGHKDDVTSLDFHPIQDVLASSSEDGTIKVWETKSYTETQLIKDQPEVAMAMVIAPDGKKIVTGRLDGTIEQFAITKQKRVETDQTASVVISPKTPMAQAAPESLMEQEPNQTADSSLLHAPNALKVSIITLFFGTRTLRPFMSSKEFIGRTEL